MMNTHYGSTGWEGNPVGYSTVESLLDEAAFNLRRYTRGNGGQRTEKTSGSMRIVKPNSTSNSPRGSMGLGRRKTVMSDRRRMAGDHALETYASQDGFQHPAKSSRPVSWHPSTQNQPQQMYYSSNPITHLNNNDYHMFDIPTPIVYSGYGSPSSTFSPVSMPFTGYEQQPHYPTTYTNFASHPQMMTSHQVPQYISTPAESNDSVMYSQLDWANFAAAHDFQTSTAPPTPENFLPIQHPDPTFPAEEAIPYHPLSEDPEEEEGEVLRGLGLYDAPEVLKSVPSDPQLDNYRSSVMSNLLGSGYRCEATGKGLKLEEGWSPASEDEEEEDEEADGEGEDEEEIETAQEVPVVNAQMVHGAQHMPYTSQDNNWV